MSRLPLVDPASAPPAVQEVFSRLAVPLGIFRLMANAETCFRPLIRLGTAVLGRQSLDPVLREIAILRVAARTRARYEWEQHVPIARAVGASDAQIAALEQATAAYGDAPRAALSPAAPAVDACWSERERAVLTFTDTLLRGGEISAEESAAIAAQLPPAQIVELVLAVGYYWMLGRLMVAADLDLDPPVGDRIIAQMPPRRAT